MTDPAPPARAFVDRPITDVAAAERVARYAAGVWELGEAPVTMRTGMNAIFRAGDVVIRVGHPNGPAESSLMLAEALRAAGITVPAPARDVPVSLDGMSATAWRRVAACDDPVDWRTVGVMVAATHRLDPDALGGTRLPRPEHFPWWDFPRLLGETAADIDERARTALERVVAAHSRWPAVEGRVVCHGDVHPGNVIMTSDGPVLIDWDLVCWAPPAWDHAPMMTWASHWGGAAGEYEAFADGYGRSLRDDPVAEGLAELRLVAATLMRVIAGRSDPRAADEAQRRLRYWRGDDEAPMWRAQ